MKYEILTDEGNARCGIVEAENIRKALVAAIEATHVEGLTEVTVAPSNPADELAGITCTGYLGDDGEWELHEYTDTEDTVFTM